MITKLEGLQAILNELSSHVTTHGQLTMSTEDYVQKWDISRVKGGLMFGPDQSHDILFRAKLSGNLINTKGVGMILRTFTDKRDEVSGLPIKEIRSYFVFVRPHESKVEWHQLTADETAKASGVDPDSGKILPMERAVVFCGP
jgi:hypothetical protein